MNTDDPKFTAHALGELDDLTPAERAEIAALLAADADAAADAEETRALAARLRSELQSEQSAPLTDAQRAAVLAANAVPVSLRGSSDLEKASVRPWRPSRVLGSLALAASVVLCASLAWKAEFQKPRPSLENLTITPQSPALDQPAVEEVAAPHPEPDALVLNSAPAAKPIEMPKPVASAEPAPLDSPMPALAPVASVAAPPVGAKPESVATNDPALPTGKKATAKTQQLLSEAEGFYDIGRFEFALKRYEQVLKIDKYNKVARAGEEKIARAKSDFYVTGYNEQRSRAIANTDAAWANPVRRFNVSPAEAPAGLQLDQSAAPSPGASDPALGRVAKNGALVGNKPAAAINRSGNLAISANAIDALLFGEKDVNKRARGLSAESLADPSGNDSAESYDFIADNAFLPVAQAPLSTFSIDVDTASYAIVRRFLNEQHLPPKGAVRIEELINYFTYDYPQPQGDAPFSATMEVAACPWTPAHRLVRIGLKGREIAKDQRPASNLVFLIDVSGSMEPANKLPLLKQSLGLLIDQLGAEDQVAMVVYAGNSGCVLEPTHSKAKMRAALKKLEAGGSTNGASGIQLAYDIAEKSFIKGGTNRVILATDGDWNVGITNPADLFDMIAKKAKGGVFLTVLGVGMDNLKDSMLVKLADKGNGNYGYLDTLIEAKKLLADQLSGTLVTIAKDVKIQVEFNPAQVAAYRLIGYEKRLLAKEDFNDDTKDAGEIGAGHTVTALYEIVPAGGEVSEAAKIDDLKYQPRGAVKSKQAAEDEIRKLYESGETLNRRVFGEPPSKEMLTLKLRYKAPDGDVSKLLEFPLTDTGATWEKSSRDFRFAAAVAGYGMLLRDSPHKGSATWNSIRELAVEGKGDDATGYRAEFVTLLEKAKALAR